MNNLNKHSKLENQMSDFFSQMSETKAQEPLSLGLFYAERDAAQADGKISKRFSTVSLGCWKKWDIKTLPPLGFFSTARPMTAQWWHWRQIFSGRMIWFSDFRDRKDDQDLIALVKHLIAEYGRCIEWKTFVGLARVLRFTRLLWAFRNMLISHSTTTIKRVELLLFHSDHDGCWHRGTEHFCLADIAFEAGRSSCCELPLEEVSEVCNCWNLKLTELPIIDSSVFHVLELPFLFHLF